MNDYLESTRKALDECDSVDNTRITYNDGTVATLMVYRNNGMPDREYILDLNKRTKRFRDVEESTQEIPVFDLDAAVASMRKMVG